MNAIDPITDPLTTFDPITHLPIDATLRGVLDKIDARIALYNGAIDRRVAILASPDSKLYHSAANLAYIAAEIARYGAAKAELINLKETL